MNEQCLGIDWGTKRIGLALGNTETKLASPLVAVSSVEAIQEVVKKEEINRLVVGMPYHANNSQTSVNSDFKAFLEALEAQIGLPITQVDERFSSQLADQLGTGDTRDGDRDTVAAMIILQTYFDSLDNSL